MAPDPEAIVEAGYDEIAVQYQTWISQVDDDPRLPFLREVLTRLPARPASLDLGCGAGVPCTALLAEHGEATGVDISAAQVELARRNVPGARFVKSSMASADFPPAGFDLVTAFYSIPHLPRTQHGDLLQRIARWLRPGGLLLATLGHRDVHAIEDFMGTPMLTSCYDPDVNRRLLLDAGLTIVHDEILTWHHRQVTYQWVIAGKPHG